MKKNKKIIVPIIILSSNFHFGCKINQEIGNNGMILSKKY